MSESKFHLGETLATPGALDALRETGQDPTEFFNRHQTGDWGLVCEEDWQANEDALKNEERLLSKYVSKNGTVVWIITEADRSATTILLPEEY